MTDLLTLELQRLAWAGKDKPMREFPADPVSMNNLLVSALCEDLFDMVALGTKGTPRADRIAEISRQLRVEHHREAGVANNAPASPGEEGR